MTLGVVDEFPDERWFVPIAPGKAHANWLFGHLTHTLNNALLKFCLGGEWVIPEAWGEIYGPAHRGGRAPESDPAIYIPAAEIRPLYQESMEAVLAGIAALTDADLDEPPRGMLPEQISPIFATIGSALGHIVQHDAYHRGQIVFLKSKD